MILNRNIVGGGKMKKGNVLFGTIGAIIGSFAGVALYVGISLLKVFFKVRISSETIPEKLFALSELSLIYS